MNLLKIYIEFWRGTQCSEDNARGSGTQRGEATLVREGLSEEVTLELNVQKESPLQRTGEASKRKHHMQRS